MKNEYKIDYVSIHEDGDMTQRSFENKGGRSSGGIGALERAHFPSYPYRQKMTSGCQWRGDGTVLRRA